MTTVSVRELRHHTSRYLAWVKAGRTVVISERGRVIALLSPASEYWPAQRRRPRVGGYCSAKPLRAGEIDAELIRGFGADDNR